MDSNNMNQNQQSDGMNTDNNQNGYYRNNNTQGGDYSQNTYMNTNTDYQQNSYNNNTGYQQNSYNNNAGYQQNSYNNNSGYPQNPYNNAGYQQYQPIAQDNLEEPVTMGEWIISFLILMVPCVNIIMTFVWAFSSSEKKSKSNFFKAYLILLAISLVLSMVFGATLVKAIVEGVYNMY